MATSNVAPPFIITLARRLWGYPPPIEPGVTFFRGNEVFCGNDGWKGGDPSEFEGRQTT